MLASTGRHASPRDPAGNRVQIVCVSPDVRPSIGIVRPVRERSYFHLIKPLFSIQHSSRAFMAANEREGRNEDRIIELQDLLNEQVGLSGSQSLNFGLTM